MKTERKKFRILLLTAFVLAGIFKSSGYFKSQVYAKNADYIVRVAFRGLENMFHAPYEYDAVCLGRPRKVTERIVKERFGEEIEKRSIYGDEDTSYWFVELEYAEDGEYYFNNEKSYLETSFGGQYRLFYSNWTSRSGEPDGVDLKIMLQAAEYLYDEDLSHWESKQGDTLGLISFMLIRNGDTRLIENNKALLEASSGGDMKKVMDVPPGGQFDYYFFAE